MSSQADGIADAVLSKPTAQAALSQIEAGQVQLDAARAKANQGLGQLEAARATLDQQRASAEAQLEGGRAELAEGSADAAEGQAELDEQKASANAKFADARSEVDGIERATWYIQDRSSLASYASIESDASSIESIATVFPLIFFTVAVLISLTTVTRMVEEDRGLIGVYKALGYSRGRILSKYLIYSFAACVAGGIAGDALGFIVLPEIIFTIFTTMYALPPFQLHFNAFTAHSASPCSPSESWAQRFSRAATCSGKRLPHSCAPRPRARASASCSSASRPCGGASPSSTR